MSLICGLPILECVYCLACTRWAWKRCLHNAAHDSETWALATAEEFEPVPRLCRYILGVYEVDLRQPQCVPPRGYGIDPDCLIIKRTYMDTKGSGVAALLTIVVVQNHERLGNIDRKRIRCYAIAPARCISLDLGVRYADVINSVVLQDDFLPRTATPLEDIFKSMFCLPCILCLRCMRDTCILEERMLKDPRRLYAPGRLYHIIERKPFRCKTYPPVVDCCACRWKIRAHRSLLRCDL